MIVPNGCQYVFYYFNTQLFLFGCIWRTFVYWNLYICKCRWRQWCTTLVCALDMEDECFPTVSMSATCGRLSEPMAVKDEPASETDSPSSSCPSSPQPSYIQNDTQMETETVIIDFVFTLQLLLSCLSNSKEQLKACWNTPTSSYRRAVASSRRRGYQSSI